MNVKRKVRLSRIGRDQVLEIPRAFEFVEAAVTIRKVGETLVLEPIDKKQLRLPRTRTPLKLFGSGFGLIKARDKKAVPVDFDPATLLHKT